MAVKIKCLVRLLVLAECVCIATGLAAQNAPVSPVQGSSPSSVLVTEAPETVVTPDEHPLTGGQALGIGSWGSPHSFLKPSLYASETLDSNPLLLSSGSSSDTGYRGINKIGADVQWLQYFGRDAAIQFDGAVRYDTTGHLAGYNSFANADSVAMCRIIRFRSWKLLFDDQANYSQSSTFGAAGMQGLGLLGTDADLSGIISNVQIMSIALQPNLLPNQTIVTENVGRVANTSLVELDKHFDPRDTGTLTASYGLLHYESSLYTDAEEASFSAGLSRTMTVRDSVGLTAGFNRINFHGLGGSLSTESISGYYARRISGRSGIEVGGGPQITQSNGQQYVDWQVLGTVRYRMRNMNLSAQGVRSVSGGAGVLNGVTLSTGEGGVDLVLARNWSMSLSSGVSLNQQLGSSQSFTSEFGDYVLNRKIYRYTNLFLSYDFQHQTAAACTGSFCNNVGTRNVFGIGLNWNYRPIGIN